MGRYRVPVLLAELDVYLSRPIAPTRRIALGDALLPTAPAPGFGGILLGGIAAAFAPDVDDELLEDLDRLIRQLDLGYRVTQPRLRHRLQEDRIGLSRHRHQLHGDGESIRFDLDRTGNPAPHLLAAVYAAARLDAEHRSPVFDAIGRGLRWRGEVDGRLVEHLSGQAGATAGWSTLGGRDPISWALDVLGLAPDAAERAEVQRRFRELLRAAHPDHGGVATSAADRIQELTEARRILLRS